MVNILVCAMFSNNCSDNISQNINKLVIYTTMTMLKQFLKMNECAKYGLMLTIWPLFCFKIHIRLHETTNRPLVLLLC